MDLDQYSSVGNLMMSLPIKQSLSDMEDHDPSHTAVLECPKKMVGRVIGKGGETIKALQQYTGAVIQIDQSQDPTCVTIAGKKQSLHLAVSMIKDIVGSKFKGFAMLRQMGPRTDAKSEAGSPAVHPKPFYVEGYGFVPPSQFSQPDAATVRSLAPTTPFRVGAGCQQPQVQLPRGAGSDGQLSHAASGEISAWPQQIGPNGLNNEWDTLLKLAAARSCKTGTSPQHWGDSSLSSDVCTGLPCHSAPKPIPDMLGATPVKGISMASPHDSIPSMHGPPTPYACSSLGDVSNPATPPQVLSSGLVLSNSECSFDSPTTGSPYSQSGASSSPLLHALQACSSAQTAFTSAASSHALSSAPAYSTALPPSSMAAVSRALFPSLSPELALNHASGFSSQDLSALHAHSQAQQQVPDFTAVGQTATGRSFAVGPKRCMSDPYMPDGWLAARLLAGVAPEVSAARLRTLQDIFALFSSPATNVPMAMPCMLVTNKPTRGASSLQP
ncbi:hypothetical protein WJX73_008114 [Symbiochloris irregularis]|uniref:K Homology domain-containing protein n=1 Tax=Symbiochloris irregularis TaxID=706552 RepID=A0AAW1NWR1_9CHLO